MRVDARVPLIAVVDEEIGGTNDCRGWIAERLFRKLNLPDQHFYQFRLAFDRLVTETLLVTYDSAASQLLNLADPRQFRE
jgi:hypothetical protein